MTKPTELNTERLLLRPFRLSDIDDVLDYAGDPRVGCVLPAAVRPGIYRIHGRAGGAVILGQKSRVRHSIRGPVSVGLVELTVDPKNQTTELGYSLLREQWAQAADALYESNSPLSHRVSGLTTPKAINRLATVGCHPPWRSSSSRDPAPP